MKLFNIFKRKPKLTPEQRLWLAVEEFNEAWQEYFDAPVKGAGHLHMSPWIDWKQKELCMREPIYKQVSPPSSVAAE